MKKTYLYSMLALCVSAACHAETYPAPIGPSQSDFGGVGLLQTPTARMAREGEISLNYRDNDQYRYYSASVQLFPWLETTLRYTDVRTKQYSSVDAFSGDQTYKDKAFDLKLRLWEDRNCDGVAQAEEVFRLEKWNITAIRWYDYLDMMDIDPYGNQTRQRDIVHVGRDSHLRIFDLWFREYQ